MSGPASGYSRMPWPTITGADEQGDLVDQVVVEEPADQSAAVHLQLASRLGLQLADGRRHVTGEDGRVRPLRVAERGRCDVLGLRVQRRPDGAVARICPRSPGGGEDLVGVSFMGFVLWGAWMDSRM